MMEDPPFPGKDEDESPRHDNAAVARIRRAVVFLIGGTVLLIGLALVVLPGPALVVIPAGLAILAIEFEWSRRWLRKLPIPKNGRRPGR